MALTNLQKPMVLAPMLIGVAPQCLALHGVFLAFYNFVLALKGSSLAPYMMCCTLFSTSTIGAKHFTNICRASPILSHITNNLGSSGGQTFLHNPRWLPFKIRKKHPAPEY
jgi:hypothetical protein